jgi:chromosome segregation ATPase
MQQRSLEKRVEILEKMINGLEDLPARVEGLEVQFLQHREETRAAFSANQAEHAAFQTELLAFRNHVAKEFVQVRVEIREGDEDTRRQMRVLHEDLVERIARLGEAQEETERQVNELRGTVETLSASMTRGFSAMGARIELLDTRFTGLEKRIESLDTRFTELCAGIDSLGKRLLRTPKRRTRPRKR